MSKIVVVYASGHGQTGLIASRIAETLNRAGHLAATAEASPHVLPSVDHHDAVIVGAPVRFGKHHRAIVDFCKQRGEKLHARPNAFFSVSMSASGTKASSRREVAKAVAHLMSHSGWVPARIEPIAGALKYTRYGPIVKLVMKQIAKMAGHATDTTRDHEYTDWAQVERFAKEFAARLPAPVVKRPAA